MATANQFNEDVVIKRRLLIDGDGRGDDARIFMIMKHFVTWCNGTNESDSNHSKLFERIMLYLTTAEYSMEKSEQQIFREFQEIDFYKKLSEKIPLDIKRAQEKIRKQKEDLIKSEEIKQNKMEYDKVAKIMLELPDRKDLERNIDELEKEIISLENGKMDLNNDKEKKFIQFDGLLTASNELKEMISP